MKKAAGLLFLLFLFFRSLAQYDIQKIDSLVRSFKFSGTVLVGSMGKIIFQKGYGLKNVDRGVPNDINTLYPLGAITQTFTAALVLKLVEEHVLSLSST